MKLPFWHKTSFSSETKQNEIKSLCVSRICIWYKCDPQDIFCGSLSKEAKTYINVQDRHILAFSQVGWYVDPFQIGGIFHNGSKSHRRAQISRRRLCAGPGFPSRPTCIENINEKLIENKSKSRICSSFLFISEVGVAELCKRQVFQFFH